MKRSIFIVLVWFLGACTEHSRTIERNALSGLNDDLRAIEKGCINALTDVNENRFETIDSLFLLSKDTIWIELKSGYSKSENRLINLINLIDEQDVQLFQLQEAVNKGEIGRDDFQVFFNKEKNNLQLLNQQVDDELSFRRDLKTMKLKLKKKYQL